MIDAFSRKVIGWQLASHMRTDLVLDALRMALAQREPGAGFELVAHTDRGSQRNPGRLTPESRLRFLGQTRSVGPLVAEPDALLVPRFEVIDPRTRQR